MQEIVAKAVGKIRQLSGRYEGDMGICNTLQGEHAEVIHLVDACLSAPATDRPHLYAELRDAIVSQTKARRLELHQQEPLAIISGPTLERLETSLHELLSQLAHLDRQNVEDPHWQAGIQKLARDYRDYVSTMEGQVLPWLRTSANEERLCEMDRRYHAREESLYLHDYPHDVRQRSGTFRVGIRRPMFQRLERTFDKHPALALLLIPYALGPWILVAIIYFLG